MKVQSSLFVAPVYGAPDAQEAPEKPAQPQAPEDRTWPNYTPPFPSWLQTEVKLVTPHDAEQLLAAMGTNRSKSELEVGVHIQNLLDGTWYPEISPVYLDGSGLPLDAQHRLTAIAEVGIAAYMIFIYGVRDEAREFIDAVRARSYPDAKKIEGVPDYARQTVIAKAMALYTRYGIESIRQPSKYPVTRRQMDTWINDPLTLAALKAARSLYRATGVSQNWSAVAMIITSDGVNLDPDGFWEHVRTGEELKHFDPALTLNKWLLRGAVGTRNPQYKADPRLMTFYGLATAWNKHRLGFIWKAVSPTYEKRKVRRGEKDQYYFPASNVPDFLPFDDTEMAAKLKVMRDSYGFLKGARYRQALRDAGLEAEPAEEAGA